MTTAVGIYNTSLRKTTLLDVAFYEHHFLTLFILLDKEDFNFILVFDWIHYYRALLDCNQVEVLFHPPSKLDFFFSYRYGSTEGIFISSHKTKKL